MQCVMRLAGKSTMIRSARSKTSTIVFGLCALMGVLTSCGPQKLRIPGMRPAPLVAEPALAEEPAPGETDLGIPDEEQEQSPGPADFVGPLAPEADLPGFLDPDASAPLPLPPILGGLPGFLDLFELMGSVATQAHPLALRDTNEDGRLFNRYILKAIDYIDARYAGLGYDINGALTRPIAFHDQGSIKALRPPRTMCVAAQLEILLIAYQLYYRDSRDTRPFIYLPKRSYERLGKQDLRAHIWVDSKLKSYGTADAFINFGMGERTAFKDLRPGSFININRTNRSGHAVAFIAFIDREGNALPEYDASKVIGFRYYSSQGKYGRGEGGFGYRDAVFSKHGCPTTLKRNKRDCGVIWSEKQSMFTTGSLLAPAHWDHGARDARMSLAFAPGEEEDLETVLDGIKFNGLTTDD